ncbi:MAG: hypothetical protein HW403_80 [Dehalococcoidia bacterium]|nr:hypothetical protein [Dehalococcoidia bacterium]
MWGHMMGPGWEWGAGGGWWMLLMGGWNLLFWGAIIALIVWAVRRFTQPPEDRHPNPIDIAKERLARGEITLDQFEQIRQVMAPR